MVKSGYDEFVSSTRFTMSIIGIWPATDFGKHWYLRYQFLFTVFLIIFFVIIPQTQMLAIAWRDLNTVIDILSTVLIMVGLACIKLLGIRCNTKSLRYILFEMENHWKFMRKDHETIMLKHVKLCKFILTVYTFLVFGTIVMYVLLVLYSHKARKYLDTSNETTNPPLFINSKFFFDTDYSPTFETVWIFQLITCTVAAGAFNSFDGFFIFSILHLCGQLVNLQFELSGLINNSRANRKSFLNFLKHFVKKHFHLYKFAGRVEENFNKVFLIQVICYSVMLCLQGYQLVITLSGDSNNKIATCLFLAIFTLGIMMGLFLYCFVAEKLRDESLNIFVTAYEINWYELHPKESLMLLNIMHASKSPFEITAGKFTAFSFEYFMTVLKTSAGYLSMLLAVKTNLK